MIDPHSFEALNGVSYDFRHFFGSRHEKADYSKTKCALDRAGFWKTTGPVPKMSWHGNFLHIENGEQRTLREFGVMCWGGYDAADPPRRIKAAPLLSRENTHDNLNLTLLPNEAADFSMDFFGQLYSSKNCAILRTRYE